MKKTTNLFLSLSLFLMYNCGNSESENLQADVNSAVKNVHANLQKELNTDVPSLSVFIVSPKGTFFSSTRGSNGTPVTKDTYFRFASNTKNFTATAVLKMMQDGWLNLDDKITANIPGTSVPYVPNISDWNFPNKNQISIRQLLQHNAGIYDLTNDTSKYDVNGETYGDYVLQNFPNHQFTTTEYVKVLTDHTLSYGVPNSVYHYSNTGYAILGEIISRVYSQKSNSVKTYGNYLNDHITGINAKIPLHIKFPELAADTQMPAPYVKGFIKSDTGTEITDQKNTSGHVAEGNGVGTMQQLSDYIRTVMKGENVLKPSSVELMKNSKGAATTSQNNNYALGCFHLQGVGYGHNGATEGYLSLMLYDPATDISVIVLLPFWDMRNNAQDFPKCINAINNAAIEARKSLGY